MSVAVPERGVLTDAFIAFLTEALAPKILVGDGEAPPEGGWTGTGQPGAPGQTFKSYVTISTGEAVPLDRDSIRSAHSSWNCLYVVRSVGADRTQSDWTADKMRQACLGIESTSLAMGPEEWILTAVRFTRLGPVTPFRQTNPPTWQTSDTVQLHINRSRQ